MSPQPLTGVLPSKPSTVIKQTHSSHSEIRHKQFGNNTVHISGGESSTMHYLTYSALGRTCDEGERNTGLQGKHRHREAIKAGATPLAAVTDSSGSTWQLRRIKHTNVPRSVVAASWESRKIWIVGLPSAQKETDLLGKFYVQ